MEYLGHIIDEIGVKTDPSKVTTMVEWPRPQSVMELRVFLGLTSYYRKFILNYGLISKLFIELLKKDNFQWNPGQRQPS